jgi:hypothetical protein
VTKIFPFIILDLYVLNLVYELGIKVILIMFGSVCKVSQSSKEMPSKKSGHSDLCTLYVLV